MKLFRSFTPAVSVNKQERSSKQQKDAKAVNRLLCITALMLIFSAPLAQNASAQAGEPLACPKNYIQLGSGDKVFGVGEGINSTQMLAEAVAMQKFEKDFNYSISVFQEACKARGKKEAIRVGELKAARLIDTPVKEEVDVDGDCTSVKKDGVVTYTCNITGEAPILCCMAFVKVLPTDPVNL